MKRLAQSTTKKAMKYESLVYRGFNIKPDNSDIFTLKGKKLINLSFLEDIANIPDNENLVLDMTRDG